MRILMMLGAMAAFLLAAPLANAADGKMPAGVMAHKLDAGATVLVDAKGMTLYTFDNDKDGKSVCNGQCAQYWPPLAAGADAKAMGDWTVITRDDGSKQWAHKGKPLYTFVQDKKAGDNTGNDMGQNGTHVWHQATP
jgi:predicted lipoprotein with Yx(FWY)xxD motif